MEILSVTLKNFKSHRDRQFTFQPGTNAICGENGAGKTSILEAIAWTLFNHRGSYKNEDLIRNGKGSAQTIVSFISSRDGRTYEVQRCTSRGYTIYDPQLAQQLEYRHIEDEVMPWLRQQMGVAPGTDLGKLFANTIGVPQGTFTVDFLQPTERRKQVFDTILKVEEYKLTHQQMRLLETYAKSQVEQLDVAIERYETSLSEWEPLQQRQQELAAAIATDETQLAELEAQLITLQAEKTQLAALAQQVQQRQAELQRHNADVDGKRQTQQFLQRALAKAQAAVEQCQTHQASYEAILQAEATLKLLDQQTKQQRSLQQKRDQQLQLLSARHTELTRLMVQIDTLTESQTEIERLQPLVQQQQIWEQQQADLRNQQQQLRGLQIELKTHRQQVNTLSASLSQREQEIQHLKTLEAVLTQIPMLEQQRDRIQEQLSRIAAAKQFEAELQKLLKRAEAQRDRHHTQAQTALEILQHMQQSVPLLAKESVAAAIQAIQSGVDLNAELLDTLQQILADLSGQTSVAKLNHQLQTLKQQLDTAYRQRADYLTLDNKQSQRDQLRRELDQHAAAQLQIEQQLVATDTLETQLQQIGAALTELANPRGKLELLQSQLTQLPQLHQSYQQLEQAQAIVQQEVTQLEVELEAFRDLDLRVEMQQHLRQQHQPGYLAYLQHQKDAEMLPQLQHDHAEATARLDQITALRDACQQQVDQLQTQYDPQRWQQVETTFTQLQSQVDQLRGSLPQQRNLLNELDKQLAVLQATAEQRDRAQLERKEKDKVRKFVTFARKLYKDAGPRITELYIQTISREADRLFRELMNRPNVGLEWTRDYEIIVREEANVRRFINLSGGEQMCAALAVRLALLRVLADIDVAFFDEPTTNMDRARRESLADAIANIRSFRQLFVISHDDTFEKVTENVILVERELA